MADKKETLKYPEIPTKQAQITDEYMKDFYKDKIAKGEITADAGREWLAFYKEQKAGTDTDMKKFAAIRKEFCKKHFPSLLKKELSPIDELEEFLNGLK